jgi:hypothetical protein
MGKAAFRAIAGVVSHTHTAVLWRGHSGVQAMARDTAVIDGWLLGLAAILTRAKVYVYPDMFQELR